MLCKNCGKELPIAGRFCPFCGAPIENTGANDETAVFTPLPEDEPAAGDTPIDLSAFDAARNDEQQSAYRASSYGSDPLSDTADVPPAPPEMPPIQTPPVRRAQPSAPRTTYFSEPELDDEPFKKPGKGKKAGVIALVVVLVIALIGGGVWFALSRRPDENLTAAEKYMQRGKFEDALEAYRAALAEAKDPTDIQFQIGLLEDYQKAKQEVDSQQYAQALARLDSLKSRLTDPASPLADAVDDLIETAQTMQADSEFAAEIERANGYIADKKYDAAAATLDTLEADGSLTSEQKKQVQKLRDELTQAREAAERQEQNQQEQQQQKQSFVSQMDTLEESDKKIASAATIEEELDATATSFEAWDTLLADMYSYLEGVLSAEDYAREESAYNEWVKERDEGAANAAKDSEDEVAAKLASASFKQSYTKTRCYKLLDLM